MGAGPLVTGGATTGGPFSSGAPDPFMINFDPVNFHKIGYRPSKYTPIGYNPIGYNPMESAPYNFIDPLEAAARYNQFNLGQEQSAFNTGMQRGQQLTDLDTRNISNFARTMSGLQQEMIGSENRFNQAQRLQAVDFAMPDLRSSLDSKKRRGDTYASGRLLSSAEDRAYELAARSASADGSFTRGFGDDSVFGKRTSDVLSAQQRLGISQMGEGLLNDWVSQGSQLLIDTPLKSSISQRLPSTPPILPSQQAFQQQQSLTNLTTVPLQFGISSEINQQQFGTNLDQSTRVFNASNEFSKDQYNASNEFSKDQFNASNLLQNRQFNAANRFAKNQFNASNQLAADQFNSSGAFQASQAQFSGLQSNFQHAAAASMQADAIQRQDAHNQAASAAADQNLAAQQGAGNSGALGQIGGAIISAGGAAIGGFLGGPAGAVAGASVGSSISGMFKSAALTQPSTSSPITGGQSVSATMGNPAGNPSQIVQSGGVEAPQISSGASSGVKMLQSGGPTQYQGAPIPISQGSYDASASAQDVAQGMQATGGFIGSMGGSGPATPQTTALGSAIRNGATAAQGITSQFSSVATPEAKQLLAGQLHSAALGNAGSPETRETVDGIFSQVREHLDTGVGVKGQAAGIAGFIQNYDSYNGPERARAITNISFAGQDMLGNFGVRDISAASLSQMPIPGTNKKMNLQDAMSLSNSGYGVASLVDNWDDVEGVHSVLNGNGNVLSIASTARNLGLIDGSTPESVQKTQLALRQIGATPAGAWGVGAVSITESNKAQAQNLGMAVMGKTADGQLIAAPIASAASFGISKGVIGSGVDAEGLKNRAPSNLAIGQGAANLYSSWDQDYFPKHVGNMGGSTSVANGLYKLGATDPYLLGKVLIGGLEPGQIDMGKSLTSDAGSDAVKEAEGNATTPAAGLGGMSPQGVLAVGTAGAAALGGMSPKGALALADPVNFALGSVVSSLFGGGGKNKPQQQRDALRSSAQQLGLLDAKHNLTLADGTAFNIGVDGTSGQRDVYNTGALRPDQKDLKKVRAHDVDYTRDLDAVMNVGGVALSSLMYGTGDDDAARKMGNYFTNAAVSNAGTADLSQEGFTTAQQNLQGFFNKAGIASKEEAYALSNQMFQEGRVSQVQLVTIQQGINLAFDENAFQGANQLLEGVKLGRKGESAPDVKEGSAASTSSPRNIPKVAPKGVASTVPEVESPKDPITGKAFKFKNDVTLASNESAELTAPMEIQTG